MAGDEEARTALAGPKPKTRPTRGVFGEDLSRILALSDGVFAFAMTLLALSLVVPVVGPGSEVTRSGNLLNDLLAEGSSFYGYAFAFVMIGIWWVAHNRTFQYIARYNGALVWINMVVLLQIAVMPFVMTVYNKYTDTQTAIVLFAAIQVGLGITTTGLWDYARHAHLIQRAVPPELVRFFSRRGWFTSVVFAVSIGISFVSLTAAELSWLATFVVQRYLDRYAG